jgi:hypothetical protein
MKKIILLGLLLGAAVAATAEGTDEPVTLTAPPSVTIAAGKTATVRLVVTIAEPWHIYSTIAELGPRGSGPEPTAVAVTGKVVRREGALATSKVKRYLDPNFDMEVGVLEGSAWIDVPLAVAAGTPAGAYDADLVVSYQACDDQTCLPPQEAKVRVKIVVP